jgi:hypothetical protein
MSGLEQLQSAVNDAFNPQINRRSSIENSLESHRLTHTSLYATPKKVLCALLLGGAGNGSDQAAMLYRGLSSQDRALLTDYYLCRVRAVENEFPDLKQRYPEQFR